MSANCQPMHIVKYLIQFGNGYYLKTGEDSGLINDIRSAELFDLEWDAITSAEKWFESYNHRPECIRWPSMQDAVNSGFSVVRIDVNKQRVQDRFFILD